METDNKTGALAKFLEIDPEDISKSKYSDLVFEIGQKEYLVATDEEANKEAYNRIKEELWAFNTSFILGECELDLSGEESLRSMQEKSCKGANDFILSLVEKTCGLDQFVEDAIAADGRGPFLSPYDREENEEGDYYIYRQN